MIDTLNAGETVRCTVTKEPRAKAKIFTIERLMRRDPDNARGLSRAQKLRGKRMKVYTRGGRLWHAREKAARVVLVRAGECWSMTYTLDIASDLRSIEPYITIEKA